jgi:hypothetical protein
MLRSKRRPWPLSQLKVTGCAGVSVVRSAVHAVSSLGTATPLAAAQPYCAK